MAWDTDKHLAVMPIRSMLYANKDVSIATEVPFRSAVIRQSAVGRVAYPVRRDSVGRNWHSETGTAYPL